LSGFGLVESLRHAAASLTTGSAPAASSTSSAKNGSASAAYVKQLREQMQAMRDHLRRMAAALGAGATAVLAGLGYAQIHQLFPLPEDLGTVHPLGQHRWHGWAPSISGKALLGLVALFGAIAAPVGAAWLAGRFFGAQRRIPIETDGLHGSATAKEQDKAREVLDDYAHDEDAESLRALELRSSRFRHIAQSLPEDARKKYEAKADHLDSVIDTGLVQAAATVLERRSEQVFSGWRTKAALALAVTGFIALFGAADVAKGHRDLVDLRSKCADAVTKGSIDACDPVRSSDQRKAIALGQAAANGKTAQERADAAHAAEKLAPGVQQLYAKVLACTKLLTLKPEFNTATEGVKTAAIAACANLN
jgi:hypothetical protein